YKGGVIRFKLPATDDKPLDCTFKENPNKKGDYLMLFGKSGRTDFRGGGSGREAALTYIIKRINSGGIAKDIQSNNLASKAKFERNGFSNIDSGPEMVDPDD